MLTKRDLSQCEKEAIHIPNLVQPHGFALVIEKSSLNVTRSSANFDSTSLGPASQLVGRSLQSILPPAALAAISQKLDFSQRKRHVLYGVSIPSISVSSLNVAVCDAHREIILEFLPGEADGGEEFVELQLNDMIPRVMMAQSSEDFFQRAAIELRSLTGYDRVMIYRFDEDFNGQVIAESHEQGMESYLGLHYPASDIPVQARELYRKNMIRTIVDVSYTPVGIVSRDPAPLDMSYSYLRSVSPIHLEYLKNMGVAATLTVSIIVENALWGLVSCHHRTPYLPHMKRVGLAEVFGNIFGGMIQMREESERDRVSGRMLSRLDTVMDIVMSQDKNQDVMDLIDQRSFLFQSIFPADGFLVRTDSQIVRRQFDLDDTLLNGLLERLGPLMRGSIFYTDHLAAVLPDLPEKTLRDCAGVMALQLDTRPPSLRLWRRSEKTQTITWGGDPNQKVILNQQGVISPRKSFEKYNQIVTGQSTRWNSAERDLPRYLTAQIYRLFEFFESSHQLENQKKQIQFMEEEKAKHYQELIEMLVGVIEQRDAYTAGHTRRVADYCVAIAQKMGLGEASVSTLREAAILHDIGKVIIPDSILLKPGRLSFKEYELIKAHLSVGYQILSRIDYYKPLAEIIKHHHEKFDGTGYPEGKKGDEIPLLSHIMIVADAFDAMTTNRIYQPRKTTDDAVAELITYRGRWYQPEVVDAAVAVAREMQTSGTTPSQLPLTQMEKERFAYFFRDQLTGVYNGTYLWMVVNNLIPDQHCNFCLMIELRGMSEHNARFGWHEGNTVIRRFAEALVKMVREEQLFRVFGDDFVICFDDQPARESFLRAWQPLVIESVTATCRVVERTAFLEIL